MKRIIIILLVLVAVILSLTACQKEFKCDICGKTKKSRVNVLNLWGTQYEEVCDDCYEKYITSPYYFP
ncbi:MAG: hypothetical protein J5584_10625 [Clostridia bacterium]|nr:hypothetical protein [Clostridia bacterium]MBO5078032.1 hypothetical protein [Clostridia bacterium]